jgi:hypothetical protein
MESRVLPAQPSHPAGQQVTEHTAQFLPGLRMLAPSIALLAEGWCWTCWPLTWGAARPSR